jgi:hypothetical protein
MTGADAKRIPAVQTSHNPMDISGQEQTEFPLPGGQNGWGSSEQQSDHNLAEVHDDS